MKKTASYIAVALVGAAIAAGGLWLVNVFKNVPPLPPAPAPIQLDDAYPGHVGRLVVVKATTTGTLVKWTMLSGPTSDNFDLVVEDAKSVYFCTPIKGDYRLEAITVVAGEAYRAETHLLIDSGPQPPIPPVPPVPPVPPTPAPIVADGLTMLLIRDDSTIHDLPQAQIDIINSTAIPAYVKSVATQPKGGCRQYEVSQTPDQFTDDPMFWREAFAKAKALPGFKAPWLLISNGTSGFSGPLPATEADVIALLKKYTPAKKVSVVIFPERVLPEFAREEIVAWRPE